MTIDRAVEILVDLGAVEEGFHEYGRGASEALALIMGFKETADAAQALLTLAAIERTS